MPERASKPGGNRRSGEQARGLQYEVKPAASIQIYNP